MITRRINVVLGVIRDRSGNILISRRKTGAHQGGLWEFPGGKKNMKESAFQCLQREFMEELDLQILDARHFITTAYAYSDYEIEFDVWIIDKWKGKARGKEGQLVKWVNTDEIQIQEFPPANKKIIHALKLPNLYLICPFPEENHTAFLRKVTRFIQAGVRLLQLRGDESALLENIEVVKEVRKLCNEYNAILIVNTKPETFQKMDVHGIHLKSSRLLQMKKRPLGNEYYVAASCHNRTEVDHALSIDVDFITLSPVQFTDSHPAS